MVGEVGALKGHRPTFSPSSSGGDGVQMPQGTCLLPGPRVAFGSRTAWGLAAVRAGLPSLPCPGSPVVMAALVNSPALLQTRRGEGGH